MKIARLLQNFLFKAGSRLLYMANRVHVSPQELRVRPWREAQGDKTLRLDYALNEQSLVFDLGGYEGQWASDIFARYQCRIYIFEPVEAYVQRIRQKFGANPRVQVFAFGLASKTETAQININEYASSTFHAGEGETTSIQLNSVLEFWEQHQIDTIDLMKINIEGGEYDLLDSLIGAGYVGRITDIQVQFHDFVPDAERRRKTIQEELSKTHVLTYEFPFVWENWHHK